MADFFDLSLGFVYIQIGISGVVLSLIGCIASFICWLLRLFPVWNLLPYRWRS